MAQQSTAELDPIRLEVMRKALVAVAGEMSVALGRAAYSTNIKTRLDFSCAIFDPACRMVAQSFTQPVHLGTLTHFVPRIVQHFGATRLREGDALISNDGHLGGIHLNDVCVVAPAYYAGTLLGYVATIAHHVDVGGKTPGSIGLATEIFQEGLQIPPVRLMKAGQLDDECLSMIARNVRSPRETSGDIRAQLAGVSIGQRGLQRLAERFGLDLLSAASDAILDYTERMTRTAIKRHIPPGHYYAAGYLDDDGYSDEPVKVDVGIDVADGSVTFDLRGIADQRSASINTTYAMSFSACAYTLRAMLGEIDIDMNDGFYRCVSVVTRKGSAADSARPAAIGAGADVGARVLEVSMRALAEQLPYRLPADSKGTMCNISAGGINPRTGEQFAFYEAQAGGYGGRFGLDGIHAVQPHMQNTENSPIEETELAYPISIVRYELIPDSCGAGQYRGGLGLRRDYAFEGTVDFTVMADRQKFAPQGLAGGQPARASHFVLNPDSDAEELPSKFTVRLQPGEVISVQIGGGGGWGDPLERDRGALAADVENEVVTSRTRSLYE